MFKFFKNRELKKMVKIALSDGELEEIEIEAIEIYAKMHSLDMNIVDEVRRHHAHNISKKKINSIVDAQRYSKEDEDELNNIFNKLQMKPSYPVEFKKYRALWEIEKNGDFELTPIDDVPTALQSNETVYFTCDSNWYQQNTRKELKGYIGGSVGFRITKGVNIRVGKMVPQYDIIEELKSLSFGKMYITNKRIQFIGDKKSTNLTYGRLVDFRLFKNGIEIHKSSGKPDFFELNESSDGDMIFYLLSKIISKKQ